MSSKRNGANLGGIGVRDPLRVDPIFRLPVLGVIDLFRRIDRRVEVFKKVTTIVALSVEKDIVCIVGTVDRIRENVVYQPKLEYTRTGERECTSWSTSQSKALEAP